MMINNDFKVMFDALPDPVFVAEAVYNDKKELVDLRVVFYNKIYTEKTKTYIPLGGLYSEYMGQKVPEINPESITASEVVLKTGEPLSTDFFSARTRSWLNISLKKLDDTKIFCIIKDITSQKKQESYVGYMQENDMLTGLPNRNTFRKNFIHVLADAAQTNATFGVFIIDIDDMKYINDFSGHEEGDEVLKKCANILLKNESENVHSYRLGDDEFVILKTNVSSDDELHIFVKDLFLQLMENNIKTSIGISVYPKDETHANVLLKYADLAMHHIKRNGKCNYTFFQEPMYKQFLSHMEMKRRILAAMKSGDFELFYQPQYRIDTNELRGFEALLRWHDKNVWIAPSDFIPAAEETNTIIQLGKWILETAIATLKKWQDDYKFDGTMSVNISPVQLQSPGFLNDLCAIIDKYKIAPNTLELEITEGFFISDMKNAIEILSMIRKLGIFVALDDFGTGYSSLSYLNNLPITTLKIDKTFIDKLSSEDNVSTNIMSSIIAILSTSGIETIAEGVERPEQITMIRSLHFTNVQGFLSGKPMPTVSCEAFLNKHGSSTETTKQQEKISS